jgi:hypothetical protein
MKNRLKSRPDARFINNANRGFFELINANNTDTIAGIPAAFYWDGPWNESGGNPGGCVTGV